jgi:hypothetical protein
MLSKLRQSHARRGSIVLLTLAVAVLAGAGTLSAANDTTAPTGSFMSPASGATVSRTITVTGTASDNVKVAKVELRVDDGSYRLASGTTNWSLSIDTTAYPNGSHDLKLRVTDTSGNQSWADDPITISNGTAVGAAVGFTSPASGATVGGTITVTGTASSPAGVARVEVRVDDGSYRLASGTTSWSISIDTTPYSDGAHNLKARVTDNSGAQAWADLAIVFANSVSSSLLSPYVAFSSPSPGSTVGGTITVKGTASASAGVARVEVRVDDGSYRLASGTTSWSLSIDTTAYSNGSHNLKARVTDLMGAQAWADDAITISNGGGTTPSSKIYWGANIEGSLYGYGTPPWDWRGVDTFESHAGKNISLLALGSDWGSSSNTFPTDAMSTIRSHGSIPFYNWASMTTGGGATESAYQLSDIINGAYDSYITKFAQDAKAWGHPFFLRFDWEMNLMGTYPWVETVNGNSTGQYVKMWRHVHDIFTKVGAYNVTWVWCPNAEYSGSLKPLTSLYPGDSYVDWTCIDGYNWGTNPWKPNVWQTFSEVFGPTYSNVTSTVAPSKPLVIGETASTEYGGSKASWITDMLGTQLPKYFPKIKAFLWFNWNDTADWPIETSSSAQSAFASGIKSSYYAANNYASLGGTTVPLP